MKPITFMGTSLDVIRAFPLSHEGQYRIVYFTQFKETVYVLHAFRKKTQKTAKEDIAAAKRALKQVLEKQS